MPQVNIKEIDNTGASVIDYEDYIVVIPIGHDAFPGDDVLFTSVQDLTNMFAEQSSWTTGVWEAYYALEAGLKVLGVIVGSGSTAYKSYEDKAKYNIRFLALGDYFDEASTVQGIKPYIQSMVACAANRGDAIALIDTIEDEATLPEDVLTFINSMELTPEQAKYAAVFAPWVQIDNRLKDNLGNKLYLPGSVVYLSCFGKHTKSYPDWFAMAGSIRGKCEHLVTPEFIYGDAEVNELQKRTYGSATFMAANPICRVRPYGNIIWGNRTAYPLTEEEPELRASSFLNIRNLCCDIKKELYRVSRKYTFEPNSDTLWINFTGAIKPLLEKMRANQGIKGYKLIKGQSKDKAVLKATIRIIPIEAVEDFDLTVELTDSVVDVQEADEE